MIDRREFFKKTTIAVLGTAILPAVLPDPWPKPYEPLERRYYVRMAIDNHVAHRLQSSVGAFNELQDRVLDKMWMGWSDMNL